jgi:hypothetical protein
MSATTVQGEFFFMRRNCNYCMHARYCNVQHACTVTHQVSGRCIYAGNNPLAIHHVVSFVLLGNDAGVPPTLFLTVAHVC